MEVGSIALVPTGGAAMMVRVVFGLTILCLAIPALRATRTLKARPKSGDGPDMAALWKRYKRGEISWDDYLRVEVEGYRGLRRPQENSPDDPAPKDALPQVWGADLVRPLRDEEKEPENEAGRKEHYGADDREEPGKEVLGRRPPGVL